MNRFARGLAFSSLVLAVCVLVGCEKADDDSQASATTKSSSITDSTASMKCEGCSDKSCATCNVTILAAVKAPPVADIDRANEIDKPTHRQATKIIPTLDGEPIKLNTFCLDLNGTILAACGGKQSSYVIKDDGSYEPVALDQPNVLLRLDSTGQELNRWELPFMPSAVDVAPNGDIFVAGVGEIARISGSQIASTGIAPHMGDIEAFTAQAVEQAKKQAEQFSKMFDDQVEQLKERIAKIEEIEEGERSRIQIAQLEAFQQQVEMYETAGEQRAAAIDPEAVVANAKQITSIAVSDQDVFWVCKNIEGSGYSIWRTDHQFENGTEVVSGISGCCGQMDIQCCNDKLVIAENTSYQVGIYDRDGEAVTNFGSRDRSSKKGFGSCCNPMNVCPLPDGSILTAESSIGHIKRFDQDGNFLDYVGKAKVAGGCKHCALGYDSNSDQYYMMHEDESSILVLANQASLPAETEEEKLAAKLMSEFSTRFLGTWEVGKQNDDQSDSESTDGESETEDVVYTGLSSGFMFNKMTFHPDGNLEVAGGPFANSDYDWAWVPLKGEQDELSIQVLGDQVEMMSLTFEFVGDNNAQVSAQGMGQANTVKATRTADCDGQPCGEKCEQEVSAVTR